MGYQQLIEPNYQINEQAGMCLSYSRRAFGLPAVEPTAYAALQRLKHFHADRNFPDASVPVWFEWWGNLGSGHMRYDHVAIRDKSGKVWSSPLSGNGRAWFNTVDDLIRAFGNGMKYLGWSEDISNARVAQPQEDIVKPSQQDVIDSFVKYLGKQPTSQAQIDYYTGQDKRVLFEELLGAATKPDAQEVNEAFAKFLPEAGSDNNRVAYYTNSSVRTLYRNILGDLRSRSDEAAKGSKSTTPDQSDADKKLQAIKDALGVK